MLLTVALIGGTMACGSPDGGSGNQADTAPSASGSTPTTAPSLSAAAGQTQELTRSLCDMTDTGPLLDVLEVRAGGPPRWEADDRCSSGDDGGAPPVTLTRSSEGEGAQMAQPVVRSRDEAHLYLDLHPCVCGRVDVAWENALTSDESVPARRYHGTCGGCDREREFVFRLPERPALPAEDDIVFFGGSEPSQLFDAGQWRLIADAALDDASSQSTGDPDAEPGLRLSFAVAVAAVIEVMKFIPEGADAVPDSAFWTTHGRAARDQRPEQFTRAELERTRMAYQERMADRFRKS
ncbi:hypothetical protein ACFQUZ_20845 [Plantactinospora sp. GCM10030261]